MPLPTNQKVRNKLCLLSVLPGHNELPFQNSLPAQDSADEKATKNQGIISSESSSHKHGYTVSKLELKHACTRLAHSSRSLNCSTLH